MLLDLCLLLLLFILLGVIVFIVNVIVGCRGYSSDIFVVGIAYIFYEIASIVNIIGVVAAGFVVGSGCSTFIFIVGFIRIVNNLIIINIVVAIVIVVGFKIVVEGVVVDVVVMSWVIGVFYFS